MKKTLLARGNVFFIWAQLAQYSYEIHTILWIATLDPL